MAEQGTIIPQAASASFPGCALSCSVLLNAQDICLPPNQPSSSQLVYDQCFCNSAFLTPLKTTIDQVCITECTIQTDRQLLQAWYNSFCAQVANGIDPTTQTSTSLLPTTATSTISATTGTVIATVTSTTSANSNSQGQSRAQNKSWIDTHWKYILMIVIILIGLALLAWLAVWLKKRHRRKLEKQRAAASGFNYDPEKRPANDPRRSATPDLWGPHQMMHATNGYEYAPNLSSDPAARRSSKRYRGTESARGPDTIEITSINKNIIQPRPSNRRARPSELEVNARMIGAADRRSKSKRKSKQSTRDTNHEAIEASPPEIPIAKLKEIDAGKT